MLVLIVDDDHLVLQGLQKLIPWEDLNIQLIGEASDGEEGYRKAMELQPDVIITDIRMPVMSGLELCEKIYHSPLQPDIIILSAFEDFTYAKDAIRFGVKDYITKPINRQKINELIANLRSLQNKYKQNTAFIHSILTEDIEDVLIQALTNQSKDHIDTFFLETIHHIYTNKKEADQLVIRIINAIYQYFSSIGLGIDSIVSSKVNMLNELIALKDPDLMFQRLHKLFYQLLQFSGETSYHHHTVQHAMRIIHQHLGEYSLTVSSIADELYITPTYLSVLFKKHKHINIQKYIINLRLNKAIDMLKNSPYKIADISKKVGYNDPRYFSKVFKKHTGHTPSHYRDRIVSSRLYSK